MEDLKDKAILDIGCGSGRFTKQAGLSGANIVVATDVGESVQLAYQLTKGLDNVCIVQADIYNMPVKQFADLAFSIGVLHHLPNPQKGFKVLKSTVKPGGEMLIWVYNRRNNFRAVYIFETLRKATRHIPKPILYQLCYLPAIGVHSLNFVTNKLKKAGAEKIAMKIPFSYYSNFPFNMKHNDSFDVFATPKSNYYYVEEVEEWYKNSDLKEVDSYEHPEAGITCIGKLKSTSTNEL